MKKLFFTAILAILSVASASAQFEKGKIYGGASASGLGISYSSISDFNFGFSALGGYMFADDWMGLAELSYENYEYEAFSIGVSCRYYIVQNGLYLSLGAKYYDNFNWYNDFYFTPEVGYSFFLNKHVTLEPSIYYNISLSDFSDKSRFGIKVGIGFFF